MFDITEPFHVGIIVADLDAAMADYSAATGCTWHSMQSRDVTLRIDGGLLSTHVMFNYSVEGPVQLELVQGLPGTPWDAAVHGGVDHLGYWSDDFQGDMAALGAAGWEFLYGADDEEGGVGGFCFYMTPAGQRVELLDVEMRPMFERWFAGGSFDEPA